MPRIQAIWLLFAPYLLSSRETAFLPKGQKHWWGQCTCKLVIMFAGGDLHRALGFWQWIPSWLVTSMHLMSWTEVRRLWLRTAEPFKTSHEPYITSGCWGIGNARVPLLRSVTVRALPWASAWLPERPEESPSSVSDTLLSPWAKY